MNLEDYFDMLHKMAQKNPQAPAQNHGQPTNHHQDDDLDEEGEDLIPPEDKGET